MKLTKVLVLATLILIAATQSAFAIPATMGVENSWDSRWFGASSNNYVMSNPAITSTGYHINSVYAFVSPRDFTEVGWAKYGSNIDPSGYGLPKLRWFVSTVKNGVVRNYWTEDFEASISNPTPDTNAYYEINSPYYDYNWVAAINGKVARRFYSDMYRANPQGSSERANTGDSGYGRFWNMKKKDYTGIWYLFSNVRENNHLNYDNDAGYYFKRNSASSFEAIKNP